MKEVHLIRSRHQFTQTLGNLFVIENNEVLFSCKTLELPYRDNERSISSIPEGKYFLKYEYSPKFKRHLWSVKNVPDRSGIRIHVGNYHTQINGCILLGKNFIDINNDGVLDITESSKTINKFHKIMEGLDNSFIHIYTT